MILFSPLGVNSKRPYCTCKPRIVENSTFGGDRQRLNMGKMERMALWAQSRPLICVWQSS